MRIASLTLAFAFVLLVLPARADVRKISTELSAEASALFERAQRNAIEGDPIAASECERVIELAPDFPYIYHVYALALVPHPGAQAAAAERFRKLAEANPDRSIYWFAYGRLVSEPALRERAFNRVVELEPNAPWGYWGLGVLRRLVQRHDEAVVLYEKALAFAPDDVVIGAGVVAAHAGAGRRPEALKRLESLVAKAPGAYDVDFAFATVLATTESAGERAALAEKYLAAFPRGWLASQAWRLALDAAAQKNPAGAVTRAREAMTKLAGARFDAARAAIFGAFVLPAALEGGRPALDKLAAETYASAETSPGIFYALGRALTDGAAHTPSAVDVLAKGYALYGAAPRSDAALGDQFRLALGLAHESAGDPARAAEFLETVEAGETFVRAQEALVRIHGARNDAAKRFAALTRLVGVDPTESRVKMLGEAEKAAGRTREETSAAVRAVRERHARPAPDFTLKNLDGKPVSLSSLRGKVVLLSFWFPACGPCRLELPLMQKVYEQYKGKGVEFLALDMTADDSGARQFFADKGITFQSLSGSWLAEGAAYGVDSAPTTIVVDGQGRMLFRHVGFNAREGIAPLVLLLDEALPVVSSQ
jgi:peroxiredoxin/tetratricopeptide (TPR) repeat protein